MADVLVHLVDASNPMWRKQVRARAPVSMYICPCEDTPLYIYMRPCEDTPLPSHPNAHPLTHTHPNHNDPRTTLTESGGGRDAGGHGRGAQAAHRHVQQGRRPLRGE